MQQQYAAAPWLLPVRLQAEAGPRYSTRAQATATAAIQLRLHLHPPPCLAAPSCLVVFLQELPVDADVSGQAQRE